MAPKFGVLLSTHWAGTRLTIRNTPPPGGYHAEFDRSLSNGSSVAVHMRSAGKTGPFQRHSTSSQLARIDPASLISY